MPINRFLQAVLISAVTSGMMAAWYYVDTGRPIPLVLTVLSLPWGIAFAPLVIIRLPLFSTFYRRDRWSDDPAIARQNRMGYRGAFPMASLLAGGAFASVSLLLGGHDIGLPCFCSATSCGVMFYFLDQYGLR